MGKTKNATNIITRYIDDSELKLPSNDKLKPSHYLNIKIKPHSTNFKGVHINWKVHFPYIHEDIHK